MLVGTKSKVFLRWYVTHLLVVSRSAVGLKTRRLVKSDDFCSSLTHLASPSDHRKKRKISQNTDWCKKSMDYVLNIDPTNHADKSHSMCAINGNWKLYQFYSFIHCQLFYFFLHKNSHHRSFNSYVFYFQNLNSKFANSNIIRSNWSKWNAFKFLSKLTKQFGDCRFYWPNKSSADPFNKVFWWNH